MHAMFRASGNYNVSEPLATMDIRNILDSPALYAAWQAPFVAQKVAPFLRTNDPARLGRVLEIGCGPGTNARLFQQAEYVGIDLNDRYIQAAQRRFGRTFVCADATSFELPGEKPFDAVFINSLLHHLDDAAVEAALRRVADVLRARGELHVLDLVLPKNRCVARWLARADRGGHARPLAAWEPLLSRHFQPLRVEPYAVCCCGVACWQMVYFRGTRRA
jgi:SAM-dependent methyltransferase